MNGTLTSLKQLLLSGWLFEIPIYQRGYAWEEENLRDLWDDLYYLGERKHYFGTILLKETDKKTRGGLRTFDHFEVIDGQQRLTTTLILLRELIAQFKELGDEEMSDQASKLEEDYIVHPPHYKLTVGGEDRSFFRDSILAGTSANDPQTRAQKRLRNAQAFFRDRFDRQRESRGRDEYLDFLIKLQSRIDRLQVMQYIVPSNAEAVRMFETVNDRGRPLTNLEKTKSILMYASYLVIDDPTTLDTLLSELNDHFSAIYRCFEDIEAGLGLRDAGEIQRYHHIFFVDPHDSHKHMQVLRDLLMGKSREDKPYCERFIRSYASNLRQAFQTMQEIATHRRAGSELGVPVDRLFLIGPVGNLYPLLIAAWQKFRGDSQRREVLRLIESFVFRVYRVVRFRSNTAQSWLNGLAYKVHGDKRTFADFLQELMHMIRHYADDDVFRRELSGTHCFPCLGTRTIRYLLAQYENKLRTDANERLTVDLKEILSPEYETEHILPQRPAGGLDEEEMAAHQEIVHRLGNLTVASKAWNQGMGNRPFEEKKKTYGGSVLRVQRNLLKWEEWKEASIRRRGDEIIDFALERWRIDPTAGP